MALTIGDRGASVRRLQQQLQAKGFDPGGVDGVFGPKTQRAVMAFQKANHLTADGQVGEDTRLAFRNFQANRNRDVFEQPSSNRTGNDGEAVIERTTNAGRRNQMVQGSITVNGHSYTFRSGGHGKGSLPTGSYEVTAHMHSRSNASMSVDGVGYSFAVSDKYDSRVGATRRLLRIHPDGGTAGTEGCIGIVGGGDVQRRFRADMEAELARNGGRYTLTVR
ncbi:MAG: peptidoglycan-binding domain-containing protein [Myxococcales bacterium]